MIKLQREGKYKAKPYTPRPPRIHDKAAASTRARELRAAGLSLRKIGARLSKEGLVPARGGKWHAGSVLDCLRYREPGDTIGTTQRARELCGEGLSLREVGIRHRCDTHLLVIATDEATARWAQRPITSFLPGRSAAGNAPMVLSPAMLPKVASVEEAQKQPGLSILAALLHAGVDGEIQEAYQTLRALHDTGAESARGTGSNLVAVGPIGRAR